MNEITPFDLVIKSSQKKNINKSIHKWPSQISQYAFELTLKGIAIRIWVTYKEFNTYIWASSLIFPSRIIRSPGLGGFGKIATNGLFEHIFFK